MNQAHAHRTRTKETGAGTNPYGPGVNHTFTKGVVSNPFSMAFNGDGTCVWTGAGNASMYKYILSTGWDLSTAGSGISSGGGQNTMRSMNFANSGLKAFTSEAGGTDQVREYNLSPAYNFPGTLQNTFGIEGQVSGAHSDIFFSTDGTKMFMLAPTNDKIHQYSMTVPWDLSTMSYDTVT